MAVKEFKGSSRAGSLGMALANRCDAYQWFVLDQRVLLAKELLWTQKANTMGPIENGELKMSQKREEEQKAMEDRYSVEQNLLVLEKRGEILVSVVSKTGETSSRVPAATTNYF
ncbi:hypothetical protein TWF970_011324 [Orbilia oligospora]|nr:hypothetical protein TWF970_011324 [Orbilia oligospora]